MKVFNYSKVYDQSLRSKEDVGSTDMQGKSKYFSAELKGVPTTSGIENKNTSIPRGPTKIDLKTFGMNSNPSDYLEKNSTFN